MLVFEIYSVRRFGKDKQIGLAHVSLHDLVDKSSSGPNFMAFHVRTSSGDPHDGILNIGVMRLDEVFNDKDMPRFIGSSLAIDYRKLMGVTS